MIFKNDNITCLVNDQIMVKSIGCLCSFNKQQNDLQNQMMKIALLLGD